VYSLDSVKHMTLKKGDVSNRIRNEDRYLCSCTSRYCRPWDFLLFNNYSPKAR
jgi:hypothetical protein